VTHRRSFDIRRARIHAETASGRQGTCSETFVEFVKNTQKWLPELIIR
jgi:hypothetical protein